jgi:hypothetical protein
MLNLVSEVFDIILHPSRVNDKNLLTILEWKIRQIPVIEEPCELTMEDSRCLEVFQLALLVCLERASGRKNFHAQSKTVAKAFTLFSQAKTFPRQFPLLIIGAEARSDEDRMTVLDLMERTEEANGVSMGATRGILMGMWAQDDLQEGDGGAVGYAQKIGAVIGSREGLPSFI